MAPSEKSLTNEQIVVQGPKNSSVDAMAKATLLLEKASRERAEQITVFRTGVEEITEALDALRKVVEQSQGRARS